MFLIVTLVAVLYPALPLPNAGIFDAQRVRRPFATRHPCPRPAAHAKLRHCMACTTCTE